MSATSLVAVRKCAICDEPVSGLHPVVECRDCGETVDFHDACIEMEMANDEFKMSCCPQHGHKINGEVV
jgi:Fe2+ or Zn2+ uptake regulation protein